MQKAILKTRLSRLRKRQKKKSGVQMIISRRVTNQMHYEDYAGDPEVYYRKSIFIIPFLHYYRDRLSSRFLKYRIFCRQSE